MGGVRKQPLLAPSNLPLPIRVCRSAVGWFASYAEGLSKVAYLPTN